MTSRIFVTTASQCCHCQTAASSFFLLNRADISTPSFLPSLKVLLRRRN